MKKISLLSLLLAAATVNLHGITLSGTAATTASNISANDSSFVIVDTTGGNTLTSASFVDGLTLTEGSVFGNYYIARYNNVAGGFGGANISGAANFNLGDGSTEDGDTFYVVAFNGLSNDGITLSSGDEFGILSGANWQLPANNAGEFSYGPDFTQFNAFDGAQFTVSTVPESSAYALLSGVLALSWVMVRRRR